MYVAASTQRTWRICIMRDVIEAPAREVIYDGGVATGSFSIAASAKAFRILIDGLYSDKPRAIVRELWSNAFDAHRDAGVMDRAFECHLPTRFEPHFSVRDFGVSLTHEQVMGLYTTVFQSTKDKSNVGVGKFGLGSKTPFAYSDQFTVTAWLDGRKRVYNAFIDEDGYPKISLFHEEETTEEQGLEVSFAVSPSDIDSFIRAAQTTIIGFEIPPVMTGGTVTVENFGKIAFSGSVNFKGNSCSYKIFEVDRYGYSPRRIPTSVRQGCVVYPLDSEALQDVFHKNELSFDILNIPMIVDVPIGSVEPTPSREGLQYDPVTSKNIVEVIKMVMESVTSSYIEKINNFSSKSAIDWYLNFKNICDEMSNNNIPRYLSQVVQNKATFRGKLYIQHELFSNHYRKIPNGVNIIDATGRIPGRWNEDFFIDHIRVSIGDISDKKFFLIRQNPEDKVTYAGGRIKQFLQTINDSYRAFWFQGSDYQLKKFYVSLGRPKNFGIINILDLNRPSYALVPSTPAVKGTIWAKMFTLSEPELKEIRVPQNSGGIYVAVEQQLYCGRGVKFVDTSDTFTRPPSWWNTTLSDALSLGIIDVNTPIYVIPRRSRKGVENGHGWKPLADFIVESITSIMPEKQALNIRIEKERGSFYRNIPDFMSRIVKNNNRIHKQEFYANSLFYEYFSYIEELGKLLNSHKNSKDAEIMDFAYRLGIYSPSLDEITKERDKEYSVFQTLRKKVENRYPLLTVLSTPYGSDTSKFQKDVLDYIMLVDKDFEADISKEIVFPEE